MYLIKLDKNKTIPLYEQIYNQIRDDIIQGKLTVGTKLPSKRKLGDFLNVSQTTIEFAYGQLTAEGFILSIPRKGFFVQAIEELAYVKKQKKHQNHSLSQVQIFNMTFHRDISIHDIFHLPIGENMRKKRLMSHRKIYCSLEIRMVILN